MWIIKIFYILKHSHLKNFPGHGVHVFLSDGIIKILCDFISLMKTNCFVCRGKKRKSGKSVKHPFILGGD